MLLKKKKKDFSKGLRNLKVNMHVISIFKMKLFYAKPVAHLRHGVRHYRKNEVRKLRIWSHLPEKSLMENFIFCKVR